MAKKAQTPYFLWLFDNRASIVKEQGLQGKGSVPVIKKACEIWKTMPAAGRKKYEDLAAKDKARYEEEVKTLGKREHQSWRDGRDGKRARKDKKAPPKRPMPGYFLWTYENREAVMAKHKIEKAGLEFSRKAAEEWKTLSDAVKKEYWKKAAAAKEQYQQDLEAYKAKKAAEGGDAEDDDEEEGDDGEEEA